MTIEHIEEGMTFGQVVEILNQLIDVVNGGIGSLEDSILDGMIDYNKLANLPSINGTLLAGDLDRKTLGLDADEELKKSVEEFAIRVSDVEKLANDSLPSRLLALESLATDQKGRVDALEGVEATRSAELTQLRTEYNAAKQQFETLRLAQTEATEKIEKEYSSTIATAKAEVLAQVAETYMPATRATQLLALKADASSTPSTATWQNLRSVMDADVLRAEAAAEGVATNAAFLEVRDRLKATIDRLNRTVNYITYREVGTECGKTGMIKPETCIEELSNSFAYEK